MSKNTTFMVALAFVAALVLCSFGATRVAAFPAKPGAAPSNWIDVRGARGGGGGGFRGGGGAGGRFAGGAGGGRWAGAGGGRWAGGAIVVVIMAAATAAMAGGWVQLR